MAQNAPETVATAANRIDACFAGLLARGEKGLITYITTGDPDIETTRQAVLAMAAAGADLVELGLPFSDPMADGPVIQKATERALAGGFRLAQAFDLVRRLRADTRVPLVYMTYYNLVLQHGLEAFARDAAAAGADGLLVPDLPLEESGPLAAACRAHGLHLVPFLAPTSTDERIAQTARQGSGFIYCVSLTGVTGARDRVSNRLEEMVARIRRHCDLPLAAGFGIGGPAQAREAARLADAVIVGSAIVRLFEEGGPPEAVAARVGAFTRELKQALRS